MGLFLCIPLIVGLLFWFFYGFAKLVSLGPATFVYRLLIICLPAAVFSSAYLIFFKRTKGHPVSWVRIFSKIIFVIGLAAAVFFLVTDLIYFFAKAGNDIANYNSFSIGFMAGNVGTLFGVAILQAFTTQKEVDWIEKRKERENRSL